MATGAKGRALTALLSRVGGYVIFFLTMAALSAPAQAGWHQDTRAMMGTEVHVELWTENNTLAAEAIRQVMEEMAAVEQGMSPWIETSELYRINAEAARRPVAVSPVLFELLERSLYYSRRSKGAFDISFASLGYRYDYRKGVEPTEQDREKLRKAIDYRAIELNAKDRTVRFHHPDLRIDLGGIAKGHAVDRAIERLRALGITSAIVTAGGDSRIIGNRHGRPWMVGIRHPRQDGKHAVLLPLDNTALSTSGDYERFFLDGERRVHHIMNPRTAAPATGVQSVSILAPLATDSDALSTTVFVLGVVEGLRLVNQLPGIDAIIIDADGKLHYSDGLLMPVAAPEKTGTP